MKKKSKLSSKTTANLIKEYLKTTTYQVRWSNEDQVHIANTLEFPSIFAHGKTEQEALDEVKIPLTIVLEQLAKENKPFPLLSKLRTNGV